MAQKKAAGSTKNGRDSIGKRRGVKKYAGEVVKAGNILYRQCGTKVHAGDNVRLGKDYTAYATCDGKVKFYKKGVFSHHRTFFRTFVAVEATTATN